MTGQSENSDRTRPDDRTVSVQEAACELGTTERTVRRWLAKGRLRGHYDGRSWTVYLSGSVGAPSGRADTPSGHRPDASGPKDTPTGQGPDLTGLVQLVDRLQRENVELGARVGYLQAKLEVSEQKILALVPPVVDQEPERPQAAWWKRLLGLEPA